MAEKNASAATEKAVQKFPLDKLAAACKTLFGVSKSTFAGATAGMSGEYSIDEMKAHINEWLKKEAH